MHNATNEFWFDDPEAFGTFVKATKTKKIIFDCFYIPTERKKLLAVIGEAEVKFLH
jgi:hypothetical protein